MMPPNCNVDPERRWPTTSHGTARARSANHRQNLPDKSSRDAAGGRQTSPQPHLDQALRSPKSGYVRATIIAAPVKSP
jgi:hypothetical protein